MTDLIHKLIVLLVPHKHNGYRPRILESESFAGMIIVLVFLKVLSIISYDQNLGADIFNQVTQSDLYTLTNKARADNELPALKINPELEKAAQLKLQDMGSFGYFGHVSPQGITPWAWFEKARYDYQAAGENLAMDFNSSSDVMRAWLASPDHRQNILYPNFTEIGIVTGTAIIDGRSRTVVVQEFGQPVVKPTSLPTVSPIPVATALRTLPSQAIHFAGEPAGPKPAGKTVVAGVSQTSPTNEMTYLSWSMFQLLMTLAGLAALALLAINLFARMHLRAPTLLTRAVILALVALLVFAMKDHQFLTSNIILP